MEILNVKNLSFSYNGIHGTSDSDVIKNVSFSLERGDLLLITGPTGCGKSTLLRLLKRELAPKGKLSGDIYLFGKPQSALSESEAAGCIGFVAQYPEEAIVTDKVWHELSFGLENLGTPPNEIRRKTAEMAAYFGIEKYFDSPTDTLSGGQKQLLSLASVMAMDPEILILDEPTSRLDPIAASDFLATVAKINRELAVTVIIVEHRTEEIMSYATSILALGEDGSQLVFAPKRKAVETLIKNKKAELSLPSAAKLFLRLGDSGTAPLTVTEGRNFIESSYPNSIRSLNTPANVTTEKKGTPALEFHDICFRYEKNSPDVLKNFDLTVYEGECLSLIGGNGSGKSTFLKLAAGLISPYCGKISLFEKKISSYKNGSLYKENISLLPQDVKTCFLYDTVKEELDSVNFSPDSFPIDLSPLYSLHPYDLSGGQMQLTALAKVLAAKPRILLLDEPTKGLDAYAKEIFKNVIRSLSANGITVITVTHDIELAAEISDRAAMLFRGEITSVGAPNEFFSKSSFFTTAVSRMTRGHYNNIVTLRDAVEICLMNRSEYGNANK